MIFDGFIRVYKEGRDEGPDEDAEKMLPELTAEQLLRMLEVLPEQHFTQPPPRFTRGVAGEDARGARHRPPVHLRVDHRHDPAPRST